MRVVDRVAQEDRDVEGQVLDEREGVARVDCQGGEKRLEFLLEVITEAVLLWGGELAVGGDGDAVLSELGEDAAAEGGGLSREDVMDRPAETSALLCQAY